LPAEGWAIILIAAPSPTRQTTIRLKERVNRGVHLLRCTMLSG
jgi:hypothetical protein